MVLKLQQQSLFDHLKALLHACWTLRVCAIVQLVQVTEIVHCAFGQPNRSKTGKLDEETLQLCGVGTLGDLEQLKGTKIIERLSRLPNCPK